MVDSIGDQLQPALRVLDLELPEVPMEIPVVRFDDAQRMIEASTAESVGGTLDSPTTDPRTRLGTTRPRRPRFNLANR
jgi:hypothetical protein